MDLADMSQTSTQNRPVVNGKQEAPQLKIEIPANRYESRAQCGPNLMVCADMTCCASREYLSCLRSFRVK